VVLAIGLQLPLWDCLERVWMADGRGHMLMKEAVPIWRGLTERRPASWRSEPGFTQDENRNVCLGLLAGSGIAGAVVYLVRRPRTRSPEAGDYLEGPDGSIPDGRASTS
jgi:hypothetical protein